MTPKLQIIKNEIIALEGILVGSLLKQFKNCGKETCRCSQGKKYWHGPYYIWTRKENGKTATQTLNSKQAQWVKKSLQNTQRLNKSIKLWRHLSAKYLEQLK